MFNKLFFRDQLSFYKDVSLSIVNDKIKIIKFAAFIMLLTLLETLFNSTAVVQSPSLVITSFYLMAVIQLFYIFSPVFYYKLYYKSKKGIVEKVKSFFNFFLFAIISMTLMFLVIMLPITLTDLASFTLGTSVENTIAEGEKIVLGFGFFEWFKIALSIIISLLLTCYSVFIVVSTYYTIKMYDVSYLQALLNSIKAVFKNALFLLIPLSLVLSIFFGVKFLGSTGVMFLGSTIDININIDFTNFLINPLLIAFTSHYLYHLYIKVFSVK